MMPHELIVPSPGESIAEVEVTDWLKAKGEYGIKLEAVESALRDDTRLCTRQIGSPPCRHSDSS